MKFLVMNGLNENIFTWESFNAKKYEEKIHKNIFILCVYEIERYSFEIEI